MSLDDPRLCSDPTCSDPATARGLCGLHYQRARAAGCLPTDWEGKGVRRQRGGSGPSHSISEPNEADRTGVCATCGPVKIRARSVRGGGRRYECLPNKYRHDAKTRKRRPASPEVKRRAWLKANYGISPEEYDAMLDRQGGVCAICRQGQDDRALAVDHDHLTGVVRGLLCKKCNFAIGWLDDSPRKALAAHRYLKETWGLIF